MYPSASDQVYGTFIETYRKELFELNKEGENCLICIKGRPKDLIEKAYKYFLFYTRILYNLIFKDYDVIYVQTITTTILPLIIVDRFKRLNLVFNVHGSDVITVKKVTAWLKRLSTPLLYKAKLIVCPSSFFRSIMIDMLPGIDENKIIVSSSGGINIKMFYPTDKVASDILTLGYVSRIEEGKGWELFVKTLSKLIENGYDVKGIIAGRGNEVPQMKEMIYTLGLSDTIEYMGPVKHADLPDLYNRFDLFLFPTKRLESLGLVGVEALACGVPVIASNLGGIPGYLQDGQNGFLFEPDNPDDLFDKVLTFINLSADDKERMSSHARSVAERFDTKVVMKELYERLLALN